MALNFPSTPTEGQEYSSGTKTWTWNGTSWTLKQESLVKNLTVVARAATSTIRITTSALPVIARSGSFNIPV